MRYSWSQKYWDAALCFIIFNHPLNKDANYNSFDGPFCTCIATFSHVQPTKQLSEFCLSLFCIRLLCVCVFFCVFFCLSFFCWWFLLLLFVVSLVVVWLLFFVVVLCRCCCLVTFCSYCCLFVCFVCWVYTMIFFFYGCCCLFVSYNLILCSLLEFSQSGGQLAVAAAIRRSV